MENINDKDLVILLREKFPKSIPYLELHNKSFGSEQGLTIQMIPFADYFADVMQNNEDVLIRDIFAFIEFLICKGTQSVQQAITTGLVEYLLNNDPSNMNFGKWHQYLGKKTIAYCRYWDTITGVRTEGVWADKQQLRFMLEQLDTYEKKEITLSVLIEQLERLQHAMKYNIYEWECVLKRIIAKLKSLDLDLRKTPKRKHHFISRWFEFISRILHKDNAKESKIKLEAVLYETQCDLRRSIEYELGLRVCGL